QAHSPTVSWGWGVRTPEISLGKSIPSTEVKPFKRQLEMKNLTEYPSRNFLSP
ncbi:hypothetical protein CSUI_010175, partial [Cystoisospora suis]